MKKEIVAGLIVAGIVGLTGLVFQQIQKQRYSAALQDKTNSHVVERIIMANSASRAFCIPARERASLAYQILFDFEEEDRFNTNVFLLDHEAVPETGVLDLLKKIEKKSKSDDAARYRNARIIGDDIHQKLTPYRISNLSGVEMASEIQVLQARLQQLENAVLGPALLVEVVTNARPQDVQRLGMPSALSVVLERSSFVDFALEGPWWQVCEPTSRACAAALEVAAAQPEKYEKADQYIALRKFFAGLSEWLNRTSGMTEFQTFQRYFLTKTEKEVLEIQSPDKFLEEVESCLEIPRNFVR